MKIKKILPEIILGSTCVVLSLALPQMISNMMNSSREFKQDTYKVSASTGIWPFSPKSNKSFKYTHNELAENLCGILKVYSEIGASYSIDDLNGDFKPDRFYQNGVTLYRADNTELFKKHIYPLWEENINSLNVRNAHKEWILNYGKISFK